MVLGCLTLPIQSVRGATQEIKRLKHEFDYSWEDKWTRVSTQKLQLYSKLIEYFWDNDQLEFRCVVVNGKSKLDHESFNQGSHDAFYYKMFYQALVTIVEPSNQFRIYLDLKDTRGAQRAKLLREILCTKLGDPDMRTISRVQNMRSHESEFFGILDLLIGAVAYANRGLTSSEPKLSLVNLVRKRADKSLRVSSLKNERKFNIFQFDPQV
jgi:hypothetical protein